MPDGEPTELAAPAPTDEVVVWGRLAVDHAHDELVDRIEELGYRTVHRRDGVVILRGSSWQGRVFVFQDGELGFTHPIVGSFPLDPAMYATGPQNTATDLRTPRVMDKGQGLPGPSLFLLPSGSRKAGLEHRVLDATTEERAALRAIMERTAQEEALFDLPDRLDRLWTTGSPLVADEAQVPESDRRAAALQFWASRPDDGYGARATAIVETWIAATLTPPPTPEERATYEPRRKDGRSLP